jgi:hypothetical protein
VRTTAETSDDAITLTLPPRVVERLKEWWATEIAMTAAENRDAAAWDKALAVSEKAARRACNEMVRGSLHMVCLLSPDVPD